MHWIPDWKIREIEKAIANRSKTPFGRFVLWLSLSPQINPPRSDQEVRPSQT